MGGVLLVSPHPDDVLWGCLGYVLKYKEYEYTYLILSKGEQGSNNVQLLESIISHLSREYSVKIRLVVEDFPDTKLNNYIPEITQLIKDTIREENVPIIFVTSIEDHHQDHRAAFMATEIATRYLPVSVVQYNTPSSYFKPNLFVSIPQNILEIKRRILLAYKESAKKQKVYYDPSYIEAFHLYYSIKAGSPAEAFSVHKLVW
jgi:Uncharacterized proteins, LmbE homologs